MKIIMELVISNSVCQKSFDYNL